MVKLQIITLDTSLPKALQDVFLPQDEALAIEGAYVMHTIKLEYLGDEHIIPLNLAYSTKQIVHWSCEGENAFDYVYSITLN